MLYTGKACTSLVYRRLWVEGSNCPLVIEHRDMTLDTVFLSTKRTFPHNMKRKDWICELEIGPDKQVRQCSLG